MRQQQTRELPTEPQGSLNK